jgi:ribosomal protein S18 acetylase RimI-like enzyme
MRIRPAKLDDTNSIAALLDELGYAASPEQVRHRLGRLLARADRGVLVAEIAGETAAVASYQVIDLLERDRPHCRITALVTATQHRRRSAATALVNAIESAARQRGCSGLEVTTRPRREDAVSLYTAIGFRERPRRFVKDLSLSADPSTRP